MRYIETLQPRVVSLYGAIYASFIDRKLQERCEKLVTITLVKNFISNFASWKPRKSGENRAGRSILSHNEVSKHLTHANTQSEYSLVCMLAEH